jgi:methionyl aminopeptidase
MREADVSSAKRRSCGAVVPGVTQPTSTPWPRSASGRRATPAFKGYHGYPATICASVNDEVIHGIPSGRR